MAATLHELTTAVDAGVAYVVLTGDSVASAADVVAEIFELDPRERKVCRRVIRRKLKRAVHVAPAELPTDLARARPDDAL